MAGQETRTPDPGERIASLVDASEAARSPIADGVDEPDSLPPSSSFDGEDFLFHLYRGSELLQDNCFGEAKEELERALSLQPRDVEGQGLLGVVYFRLGMYPRAIQIYEEIIRGCPTDVTPKVNLALCYLKTGQHFLAKEQLEEVIRRLPDHVRAWGYLGLTYERMGDFDKALAAFERAGQPHMVRRMQLAVEAQHPRDSSSVEHDEVRAAAADAVQELDGGEVDPRPFQQAESGRSFGSGRWRAVELGEERLPAPARGYAPVPGRLGPAVPPVSESMAPPSLAPRTPLGPLTAGALVASSALTPTASPGIAVEPDGTAIVTVDGSFALRIEAIRALSGQERPFKSQNLARHARGRELDEPLGGVGTPMVLLEGHGTVVVRHRSQKGEARRLVPVFLEGEFLYVREDALVGFDGNLRHESGRLALGSDRHVPMVQLSGRGAVLVEPRAGMRSLAVSAERGVVVRGDDVLGWTGRLMPQVVGPSEAPASVSGFVAFAGDGALLLDPS